jgi:RHS repeat-associated protein
VPSWANVIRWFGCIAALFCVASTNTRAQSSQVTPNNQTGIVSYNTYAGDHENVNLATSDLNVSLPLVSLPGRNHHDATLSLLYDSHQWELSAVVDPFYGFLGYAWTNVDGGGWRLNGPRISGMTFHCDPMGDFFDTYVGDFIVTLPGGDKHHFSNTANHAYHESACDGQITDRPPGQTFDISTDGSLLEFDTSTADAVLHLRDGSSIVFHDYLGAANQVDWKDSHGNIITYVYSGANLVSVTDTLGRVINVSSTGITYPDGSGAQRTITFGYSNQTIAPTFSQPSAMNMAYNPGSHVLSILSSVTLANGRSYGMQYNNFGEVTKITYPSGGYTRYAYGALQGWYQLSQNSGSGDVRVVTNSYSCANTSGSCTAGEERVTTYSATRQQFDSNNTAITVTDALGNYTTYTFSNAGPLTDFSSGAAPIPPRELTRTVYDSSGKMWRSITTDYNSLSYWYGTSYYFPIRRTTTLDDGKVTKTEWDYDTLSGFGSSFLADNVQEERIFDYGNLSVPAVKHRFTYLKVNPVNGVDYQATLFILDRKASEQVYDSHTGSDVLMAQTTSEYDSYTAGIGASGATKHDSAYSTGYTTRGNVTAVSHWRNTDGAWLTSRNQYDDAGNILSTADPLGHPTQFSYADNFTDGINHNGKAYVTQITYPATGSVNHIERKQYFLGGLLAASCGQNFPSASACANSYTPPQSDYAKYSYDAMDRPGQVTLGDGGGKAITYNDVPPFSSTTSIPITSGTSAISLTTAATMDGLGRAVQARLTSDPLGTDYTDTVYDALGHVSSVSNPYRSTSDATYGITTNLYDALGRVYQTTRQDGSVNTASYIGNCTTTTDEATKKRKACSDALGRLTGVWEDWAGLNYETDYQYDVLGNLLRVDQKGTAPADSTQWRTRMFTYNSLSQLLTANNPESGTITYSYDNDGNLLQKTSPAPNQTGSATQTVSYCYDTLHRVVGKGYGAQSCPLATPVVTYAYDSGTNAIGHLTSLADQAGTGTYGYELMGRLATETRVLTGANNAAVSKTISYSYNVDGSVNTLTYPSGKVITYTPWHNGALGVSVPQDAKDLASGINYVTSATYGPDSALTGFVSGNSGTFAGITNTFSYNKRLQPLAMSAAAPSQTVFSIGYDFHFGNGNNGNVFGITNYKDQNRNQTFTYDALNRLISAQNAGTDCSAMVLQNKSEYWGNSYGYDAWGNLLQKSVTKCGAEGLTVTADAHNWIHASGTDYLYDAAGNMTRNVTPTVQTYNYDEENRLTGAAGYAYTYDGDGNRVSKSNGSTGTLYWYMTPGIVDESDLSGNLTDEYVFFDGERVARKSTNGVFYYFSDHLKTASVITDASGTIKSESDFYPWGGELQFVANDSNHYKFTGKERDSETQLDYFGARYYSNGLGRWVSADWSPIPIPVPYADFYDPQSLNLYQFVGGNPASKADPDGHGPDLESLVIAWTIDTYGPRVLPAVKSVARDIGNAGSDFFDKAAHGFNAAYSNCSCNQQPAQSSPEEDSKQNNNNSLQQNTKAEQAKANAAKGAASEKKVLADKGLTKNTEKISGTEGKSIPDFQDKAKIGEIKDANEVTNTKQLRIQKEAAQGSGREHELVTGTNTNVTKNAAQGTNVIRRDDLGPKEPK